MSQLQDMLIFCEKKHFQPLTTVIIIFLTQQFIMLLMKISRNLLMHERWMQPAVYVNSGSGA